MVKTKLFHDNFQNYKRYGIPRAQLVIADIPYNLGSNAYASNPEWYVGGINPTAKARRQKRRFSTVTGILTSMSIFTFAQSS